MVIVRCFGGVAISVIHTHIRILERTPTKASVSALTLGAPVPNWGRCQNSLIELILCTVCHPPAPTPLAFQGGSYEIAKLPPPSAKTNLQTPPIGISPGKEPTMTGIVFRHVPSLDLRGGEFHTYNIAWHGLLFVHPR